MMPGRVPPTPIPTDSGGWQQTWRLLKRNVIAGSLLLGPIAITLWLLWKAFLFLDGILGKMINFTLRELLGITFLGEHPIPGLGLIALVVVLAFTGFAARNVFGKRIISLWLNLLNQVPLVNRIYHTVEQISQAIFSGRREVFKKAVLVEYPRKDIYSIGIMTADTTGKVQDALPEDCISVFLPTTPNPTSGYLLFIPKKDVIPLNITVEEALKLIISGGTISALEEPVRRLQ